MVNAYLVDDEEHALNILDILLKETGGVEVVGRAVSPVDALQQIKKLKPDVVFLDIEMPGMYGIELAERIQSELSTAEIVFVTAHEGYAVAAFEQEALDYLLKPLDEERLALTVQRIRRKLAVNSTARLHEATIEARLQVNILGGFEAVNDRQEPLDWHTAKVKELFAFLLLHTRNGVHRDVIIDALWEDENYSKSKIYLHTCVSYLRKNLKKHGIADIVSYKDEKYYVKLDRVDCDYFVFQSNLSPSAYNLYERGAAEKLEAALDLYRGPLLLHCDYAWARAEIERTHKQWMDTRLYMAEYLRRQGEWRRAIKLAEQLLDHCPYDEAVYRLLMDCYGAIGKHDEVARMYKKLKDALGELQVEPMNGEPVNRLDKDR